jgi:hypothetical protein
VTNRTLIFKQRDTPAYISLTNISEENGSFGYWKNSSATVRLVRKFADEHYSKFLEEYETAISFYD